MPQQQVDPLPVPKSPATRHRTKSCPFCAETIRYEAVKCRFCGEFLPRNRRQTATQSGLAAAQPQPEEAKQVPQDRADDNEILWSGRPSLFALAGAFLKTTCFVAVCWAVYRYPVTLPVNYIPKVDIGVERLAQIEAWVDLGALVLAVAVLLALVWKSLSLKSIYYEVTPDRIEWSRGIFDRHVDNIDMFRVIDLKLRRSLLEYLLGIGTVVVTSKDESDPHFQFVKVHGCRRLYDIIKEAGLKADKKRGVIHLE
jgi:membrane protein YdbS with pleckstrin-like domain